jgi:diaminopimelate epimerase
VQLRKHHGLGNDFLIALDVEIDADLARRVCDRHTGVGADGLISVARGAGGSPESPLRWRLLNADGSPAESSGNGLRCAAQAVARATGVEDLDITFDTPAGPRRVTLSGDVATVEMGAVTVEETGRHYAKVSTGNPHLVMRVDDVAASDLLALGAQHPDVNVEVISVAAPDELAFRVHERGAGITMACGTGSVAAAAAAHAWRLVGRRVVVHNPGGDVTVDLTLTELAESSPNTAEYTALLTGETVWIADVEI